MMNALHIQFFYDINTFCFTGMLRNFYILVIKLYSPLLNTCDECKLQKLHDLHDYGKSNSTVYESQWLG